MTNYDTIKIPFIIEAYWTADYQRLFIIALKYEFFQKKNCFLSVLGNMVLISIYV